MTANRTDVPLAAAQDDLTLVLCFRRAWKDNINLKLTDVFEVKDGAFVGDIDLLSVARMLIELEMEQRETANDRSNR